METFDLLDGQVNGLLPVIQLEVQALLNSPATATFTCHVRDVPQTDVWPRLRGIGVTWYGRPIWVGFVDAVRASSGGTMEIGAVSMDGYLAHRILRTTQNYQNTDLCQIGVDLVGLGTVAPAPLLTATATGTCAVEDRIYSAEDRPLIGDLVNNLVVAPSAPDYRLIPQRTAGVWSAVMDFQPQVGRLRRVPLRSNVHAASYGLDVDGADLANYVDAQAGQKEALAQDVEPGWVRWDAAPTFTEGIGQNRLDQLSQQYLDTFGGPAATPAVQIPGDLYDRDVEPGDTLERLVLDHPRGICFDGQARVLGVTWQATPDAPDVRDLILFTPRDAVQDAIFDAPCSTYCADC